MARLISRQEAARLLDVSEQTVSNWIQKGVIKGHLIENRLYVDRETIEQYLDGLQDLAHLENSVKEKTKYLREEDFNLQFEIDDLLEARDRIKDGPRGYYRWVSQYATMSAHGLFTGQQKTIFHKMMNMGSAELVAKELGISRSRVVDIFFKCLRKISDVINLQEAQEKWDKLEQENKQLKVLNASLKQQLDDLRVAVASMPSLQPISKGEQINKTLDTSLDSFNFTQRSENILKSIGCKTLGDVICLTRERLMSANNCGRKTVDDIEKVLADNGYALGVDLNSLLQNADKE
jgi:excisionase family DNA binding protein